MAQNLIVCRSGQSTGIDKVATAVINSNTNSFNIFWNASSNSVVVNLNLGLSGLSNGYALTVTHVGFEMYRYSIQSVLYNGNFIHQSILLVDSARPFIQNQQTYNLCGVITDTTTVNAVNSIYTLNDYKYAILIKHKTTSDEWLYCNKVILLYNTQFQTSWFNNEVEYVSYETWLQMTDPQNLYFD